MSDQLSGDAARVENFLRQQAAIADFGSFALREDDLEKILAAAARACADGMNVPFCKVCRYRAEENDLVIETGVGWNDGVFGCTVLPNISSPQGRAFITGLPAVCNNLIGDTDFVLPPFYAEHNIISTVDVIIKGPTPEQPPYGILEICSAERHDYDEHDIHFLTIFANVLSEAVATAFRNEAMHTAMMQMQKLVEQKNVLAQELQHRVRNNLQLVYSMLIQQLDEDATGVNVRRRIQEIARRVSVLAQVYDHLLGTEMTRTLDFGRYSKSLCVGLSDIQTMQRDITLTCITEHIPLDLDDATTIGIVMTEIVSNSYDHAFPSNTGTIVVNIRRNPTNPFFATMTIRDNGTGFTPQAETKRHGLGLVRRLVEQVNGIASLDSNHGTSWTIAFPITSKNVHYTES